MRTLDRIWFWLVQTFCDHEWVTTEFVFGACTVCAKCRKERTS